MISADPHPTFRPGGGAVQTLSVYTGPSLADTIAAKCREAGMDVPLCGTEFIYPALVTPDRRGAPDLFLRRLRDRHGTDFGLGAGGVLPGIIVLECPIIKAAR